MIRITKKLFSLVPKKFKKSIVQTQIFVLINAGVELLTVLFLAEFINIFILNPLTNSSSNTTSIIFFNNFSKNTLFFYTVSIFLIKILFYLILQFAINKTSYKIQETIREKCLHKVLNIKKTLFNNSDDDINLLLGHSDNFGNLGLLTYYRISSEFFIISVLLIGITYQNIFVGIIIITSGIAIYLLFSKLVRTRINEISKQISKARTKQISIINQSVFNKIHIFFLNKSEIFTSKLKAYSVDFSKNSSVRNIYVSSTRIFIDLIFLLIVFFIFNSANLISDNFNGSEISFIVLSIFKILPSLSSLMSSVTNFRTSEYSLDELNKLLLIKKEPLKEAANRKSLSRNNRLEVLNLEFSYGNNEKIINNLVFSANQGDLIGVYGPSGSGKSTLIKLLITLLHPTSGDIKYDGESIYLNEKKWIEKIVYIPQNVNVFNFSIKENISLDENKVDIKKIEDALHKVNLNRFLENADRDLNYEIDNSAENISGGEAQRLAIARSFYHDKEIIIFDEPTSSLDKENEVKLLDEISVLKKEKIFIIVSHSEDVKNYCDKVVEL